MISERLWKLSDVAISNARANHLQSPVSDTVEGFVLPGDQPTHSAQILATRSHQILVGYTGQHNLDFCPELRDITLGFDDSVAGYIDAGSGDSFWENFGMLEADKNSPSPSRERKVSLRSRILFWMLLLALVPLTVMAYQGYHCARQAIVQSEEAYLKAILQSRKVRIEAWIAERETDIRYLSDTPCSGPCCAITKHRSGLLPTTCEMLDKVKKHSPSYGTIAAYDLKWELLRQTKPTAGEATHHLSQAFKQTLGISSKVGLSPTHPHAEGGLGFHIGYPSFAPSGVKTGYVVANLNPSQVIGRILLDTNGLGKTGRVYLQSIDGPYLLPAAPNTNQKKRRRENSDKQHAPGNNHSLIANPLQNSGGAVREYRNASGREVLGVEDNISILNWVIVVEKDQEEAFAWLHILKMRAWMTGIMVLLLVVYLSFQTAHRLSRPFRDLAALSRRVAGGNHGERVPGQESVEAQKVAIAFNHMLDSLARNQRELVHTTALAAVGELSASIVHEMRNPLSSIKMNLGAMHKKLADDKLHAELGSIALKQVDRLERMLSDLLGYGKPVQLKLESVRLTEFFGDLQALSDEVAQAKNITLALDWDRQSIRTIVVDREQMLRALSNLVYNAMQASPQRGVVTVRIQPESAVTGEIEISVRDEGDGIPAELRETIFDPFFTTRDEGTGLGLANVKKIVEYHGGHVTAENSDTGSAIFRIFLPRQELET